MANLYCSWSKSGSLLASGSDDQHVNIHTYQGDSSTATFKLATTISTGHTANIFSVKFMPHSNDRTIVTAAGDKQVRVFDIEYSGRATAASSASSGASARLTQGFLSQGVQYPSDGNTNTRIYRSHSDRVKKIVTESSPHLFLSCSEDGEVRQWDLRQPSSAYPKPRTSRHIWRSSADDDTDVPPALISYKRYNLDINSISCSPSQPHYIALGGAHLHCFLHDRRMLGRDIRHERGSSSRSANMSEHDDYAMAEATQCVKRFAPNGQRRMKRTQNGHITACKISDANPNEMVVSWSGDFIYSFDLVHSEDARDMKPQQESSSNNAKGRRTTRTRESVDRKRKRAKQGSPLSQEGATRATSKLRRASTAEGDGRGEMALRVRYENGQSENIPLGGDTGVVFTEAAESLSEADELSLRIADVSVKVRKLLFSLGDVRPPAELDATDHAVSFTSALGFVASILGDMDNVMRRWRYPIDPDAIEVTLQTTLRKNRESARRFVQASGTVARLLGGKLHTAGSPESLMLRSFLRIMPAPGEIAIEDASEQFSYDFLKAIILWLESGAGAIVEGFSQGDRRGNPRLPLTANEGIDGIDETLVPYLLRLAGTRPILDVDSSRFEVEENRKLFDSERSAVIAFARAVKIPFEDLSRAAIMADDSSGVQRFLAQDRRTALKFWGYKVARGVLLNAGEGVNHSFIDRAFGGLGKANPHIRRVESFLKRRFENIDPEEEDQAANFVGLVSHASSGSEDRVEGTSSNAVHQSADEENSDEEMVAIEDLRAVTAEMAGSADDEDDDNDDNGSAEEEDEDDEDIEHDDDDEDEDDEENDDDDDDDEDSSEDGGVRRLIFRSAFERSALREEVRTSIPCGTHTRLYRGW